MECKNESLVKPAENDTSSEPKRSPSIWRSILNDGHKTKKRSAKPHDEIPQPDRYPSVSKHAGSKLKEMETLLRGVYSKGYESNDGLRDRHNPSTTMGGEEWKRAKSVYEEGKQLSVSLCYCRMIHGTDELSRSSEPDTLSRALQQREWTAKAEQYLLSDEARETYMIGQSMPKEVNMAGWFCALDVGTTRARRVDKCLPDGPLSR